MPRRDDQRRIRYGARWGTRLFEWLIRHMGLPFAYGLLFFVVPYYVICRPSARKQSDLYLRHRFPNMSPLRRFLLAFRHFYGFGQNLIDQGAAAIYGMDRLRIDFPDSEKLLSAARSGRGIVLVSSHVGAWQMAIAAVNLMDRPVYIQMDLGLKDPTPRYVDLASCGDRIRVLSSRDFLGGMVEMTNALGRGECVALMGDRVLGARVVAKSFLGAPAPFPITPYHLALATDSEIMALFSRRTGPLACRLECHSLRAEEMEADKRESIDQMLGTYVSRLENFVDLYPMVWFNFLNFWSRENMN